MVEVFKDQFILVVEQFKDQVILVAGSFAVSISSTSARNFFISSEATLVH